VFSAFAGAAVECDDFHRAVTPQSPFSLTAAENGGFRVRQRFGPGVPGPYTGAGTPRPAAGERIVPSGG